ncbi:MAG: C13 family peptidase, partial [Betaproteobacteria bacterium]|nr:C13 family peptidase [Betaproteobacteria bacterium]
RTLERVGMLMNPEKDTLFLFITGHGDEDHRLPAFQPPLVLNDLSPIALSRILQDAGVKWKIVLVSACYSGGFVEPLRDDGTLIMTAAAADRSSFGCDHGSDFTWFGRAYFHDALRQTRSFTEAFAMAREIVGKQEAQEGLEPSLPQIWLGERLAPRLKFFGEK